MKTYELYSNEAANGWLPWAAVAPFLALAFLIASDVLGDPVLRSLVKLNTQGLPIDRQGFAIFLLVSSLSLLAILLLWVRVIERRSVASIGWTGQAKWRGFIHGHLSGMASILGIVALMWCLEGLARSNGDAVAPAGAWGDPSALVWIGVLLVCFAVQGSVEEVFFRGWLFSLMAKRSNLVIGVVVSSALFALAHFSRGQYWLITVSNALFGVFCCAWVVRSRSLFGVMGWHAGWNWLLAVGFGLPVTGFDVGIPPLLVALKASGPVWLSGGAHGPEASIVCVAYFLAGSALLFQRFNWPGSRA